MNKNKLKIDDIKMSRDKTLKILTCLREGIDPTTGVELSQESVFQKSVVTRALGAACEFFSVQLQTGGPALKKREVDYSKKIQPKMQGQRWFLKEENQLKLELDKKMSISAIALTHQRSCLSIEKRIEKLKEQGNERKK